MNTNRVFARKKTQTAPVRFRWAISLALVLTLTIVTVVYAAMSAQLESDQIQPEYTVFYNNKFYFGQNTTAGRGILWSYDPVAKTHQQEAVICASVYSSPQHLVVYKNKLYFAADGCDGAGKELWRFDSATGEASRVKDIYPGTNNSTIGYPAVYDDKLFFGAESDDGDSHSLYSYDADTNILKNEADVCPGGCAASVFHLAVYNGNLYFYANAGSATNKGFELYVFNGSTVSLAKDIYPGSESSYPTNLVVYDGKLYFKAEGADGLGKELWSFNSVGNIATRITDLNPGSADGMTSKGVVFDNKLYFSGNDGTGIHLFTYDGSAVTKILSGTWMQFPVVFGEKLYYSEGYLWSYGIQNQTPTDISLSSSSVAENAAVNTTVGTLSTTDPDSGDTFTYTLVSGTGSTDNISFNISGGNLRTSAVFNYESKSSYSIRVRTTDQGGLYYEEAFTISVTNVNETPTDISLSASSIAENAGANAVVGVLSTTDPDSGNTFTYTLVSGTGSTDNASFNISGGNLRTSAVFNYESKSSYSIRVRTTDQGGLLYHEEAFTITVTNVNEAPTDITLSASSIAENAGANAVVGVLSTTDPDSGNTFTYTLVTGAGDTDNASFNISVGSLRATASFNYETKNSYSIRVRTTDQGGLLYHEEAFTITVTNVNEAPTDISLSASSIAENAGANAVVGVLSTTDPDSGDAFTYTLVSGTGSTDNASFNISGGNLRTSAVFNYESKSSYSIRVRTTDQGGLLYHEEAFTITVTNVNETPTDISLSSSSVAENAAVNTTVGTLSTTDPDSGDTFTYTLVSGTGSTDNISFNISGGNLRTSVSFDYELKSSFSVRIRSTDQGGLSTEKAFTIIVSDAAENTTTSISSDSPDPSATGQPYTVAVTVAPASGSGTPGGTVSVSDGSGGTCTVTLSGGSGSCSLSSPTTGSKTVTANYNGSASWNTSSNTTSHTVSIANSTTTYTGDTPNPSALGESVTFNASVSPVAPASGVPAGTVDFKEGSSVLCSGTLSSGTAACTYSGLTTGVHSISAVYSGSAHFNTSTSSSGTHTVELIGLDDDKVSTSFTDVGNLSTSGGDAPYTYSLQTSGRLCGATNGAGNGSFAISGSTLQRKPASTAGTYSICIQSTDNNTGVIQRVFSVVINNPPSLASFSLDHQTVNVGQTHVGTLTPVDGQDPQVFTLETGGAVCSAVNGAGIIFFGINGTSLERNPGTPVGQYQVCIQVKDAENEIAQHAYTITVTGLPGELALSKNTVSTSQTVVGSFSQSGGQTPYTYSLQTSGTVCTASNGAGNSAFSINGANLERLPATAAGTYQVCAQGEDANGLFTQKHFTITVTAPPSNLQISNQSVTIQQIIVGTLTTTGGQRPFVYSLQNSGSACNATNGADNSRFTVDGNALKRLAGTAANTYSICLQTTDVNGEVFQRSFLILVSDGGSPDPGTWVVSLTSNQVIDGDGPGTLAGSLTSTIKSTTYALVDLAQFPLAGNFTISGSELRLNATADYDLQPYYPLRILATEPGGQTQYLDVVIYVMKNGASHSAMGVNDAGNVFNNTTIRLDVVSNDVLSEGAANWASLQIVRYPLHGEAWIGSIIYKPNSGFVGSDSLTYRACDNLGFCVTGEVNFVISAIPNIPVPATGFAPGEITGLPVRSSALELQDMDKLTMEIPALAVQAPVVGVPIVGGGWDITWLGSDIGWLNGSAYPTWDGNSVLTGHLYNANGEPGVFVNLHTLKWGDQIIVKLAGARYVYEVREVNPRVDPNAIKVVAEHKEMPWLTLVTCQGYNKESDSYQWRLYVRAVLVKVE